MTGTRKLVQWAVSLLLIVGLHLGLAYWTMFWHVEAQPIELPPAAMMIELEPLPPAAPKPAPPPPPEVVPEEPEPLPKLVEAPKPTIAIPPKPKPKPPKPVEPKPPVKPQPEPQPPEEAPPAPVAEVDEKAAAPQQAAISTPSKAEVTWQSKLLAHLSRYKRYPEDARRRGFEGVNRLRFVVDAEGKVLSYSLVSNSGSASIDRATLEMIRRAQPLPPPPAELLNNGSLEVVAPFVYSLERGRR